MKKLDKYIERRESVLTNRSNLESLYTLKNFPVFFGCVDSPQSEDLFADMEWGIEKETGVIQLTRLIPLDILYQAQHADGFGPTWHQYYKDFAEFILQTQPTSVMEIGGGAGQLAKIATDNSTELKWTIVEPNPWVEETDRIKAVPAFFDENFKSEIKVDAIVFSQVLEHAYSPQEFVKAIASFLKPGGKLIFAYPQLDVWLKNKHTNALNFEHTMLLTDYFVDYILAQYGFVILCKEVYKDHSHFYLAERADYTILPAKLETRYAAYKKLFMDFVEYHENLVSDLNQKIAAASEAVYLFGAHIFSIYLFAFGLRREKIQAVIDNSPRKKGKRLYGTSFTVAQPEILAGKGRVNVILKTGRYDEEIKKDILENINSEVVFW